jgi:hypothetical protein
LHLKTIEIYSFVAKHTSLQRRRGNNGAFFLFVYRREKYDTTWTSVLEGVANCRNVEK